MLSAPLITPLVFCLGPIVLACIAVYLLRGGSAHNDITQEFILDDFSDSLKGSGTIQNEYQQPKAYSQVALSLPK